MPISDEVLTLAHVALITLKDNTKYGITTHDRNLTIDGVVFKAIRGVNSQNREEESSLSPNNQELKLVSLPPNLQDAEIITAKVDWLDLPNSLDELSDEDLQIGIIGNKKYNGNYHTVENLSKNSTLLTFSRSVRSSPVCRFQFCDDDCGKNIADHSRNVTIKRTIDDRQFIVSGQYENVAWGYIRFLTGDNAGEQISIHSSYYNSGAGETTVTLKMFVENPMLAGDTLLLVDGCDGRAETCKDYDNFLEFGGWMSGGNWMPGDPFYMGSPVQ